MLQCCEGADRLQLCSLKGRGRRGSWQHICLSCTVLLLLLLLGLAAGANRRGSSRLVRTWLRKGWFTGDANGLGGPGLW